MLLLANANKNASPAPGSGLIDPEEVAIKINDSEKALSVGNEV
jgi:hypothetical protein